MCGSRGLCVCFSPSSLEAQLFLSSQQNLWESLFRSRGCVPIHVTLCTHSRWCVPSMLHFTFTKEGMCPHMSHFAPTVEGVCPQMSHFASTVEGVCPSMLHFTHHLKVLGNPLKSTHRPGWVCSRIHFICWEYLME